MALSPLAQNAVSTAAQTARTLLQQVKPTLDALNVLYDAGGGLKSTITQADLDAIASFSGLTKAQLDDGMYVLTSTLKGVIDAAYSQLEQLAARG